MNIQEIVQYRKDNKGNYVSTTHIMTIKQYKDIALDLLTKYKEFQVKVSTQKINTIELTIFK